MASNCPKCHKLLEEEEICCGQIMFTWRCRSCFKVATGAALPYGNCFLCGGPLELIPHRDIDEDTRGHAIRDALQLQLNLFNFYRLARDRATHPEQRAVLDGLCESALEHLHELEDRYRAHLDPDEEVPPAHWSIQGIGVTEDEPVEELLEDALKIERRAHDHFEQMAAEFPEGLENDVCRELEAEADAEIAMIETELEQLV